MSREFGNNMHLCKQNMGCSQNKQINQKSEVLYI